MEDWMNKMQGLMGNPMFTVGMGLLQSRYDGGVNPAAAAVQGLLASSEFKNKQNDRQRAEQLREALSKFFMQGGAAGSALQNNGVQMPDMNYDVGGAAAGMNAMPLYMQYLAQMQNQ